MATSRALRRGFRADLPVRDPSVPLAGVARSIRAWIRPGGSLWALFMQRPRPSAIEEGRIEGPPYHCDVSALHLLFPVSEWEWPEPPLAKVSHPAGWHELAARLIRRG